MPSRTSNKNKMHLPPYPPPAGTVCIPVNVPDDPQWIALFTGAIYRLSQQIWYDRDDAHTAKAVAAVWADIYNSTLQSAWGCGGMFDIRLKPGSHCIVQATMDGGVTWVDKLDMSACWKNGIKYNPATGGLGWEVEDIGFYRFPDGPYIPSSPETWFPAPKPRVAAPLTARCDAAFAAAKVLQALYRQTWGVLINWANKGAFLIAQEMMDLADSILGGSTPFDAMIGIAEEIHEQESSFQDGGFPDSLIEQVQNILYCASYMDGSAVKFNFSEVVAEFGAIGTTPFPGLNFLLQLYIGSDGLNAAGNVDAGTGNCVDAGCDSEWCYEWDFRTSTQGFSGTSWLLGTGFRNGSGPQGNPQYYRCSGSRVIPGAEGSTVTRIEMYIGGAATQGWTSFIRVNGNGISSLNGTRTGWWGADINIGSANPMTVTFQVDQPGRYSVSVQAVRMRGMGANPFGDDNC